jgi:hypothetical protein
MMFLRDEHGYDDTRYKYTDTGNKHSWHWLTLEFQFCADAFNDGYIPAPCIITIHECAKNVPVGPVERTIRF